MIKVKCPGCSRTIEVLKPGLYTCRKCKQIMRIEGRIRDVSHPFVLNEPIPMMDANGKLAALQSHYLAIYSKFAQATT